MRTKRGIVTSAKMQRTVTVTVTRFVMHPKYRKRYPVSKKFLADTGDLAVHEGDTVLIGETRPLSKRKNFRVLEVLISGRGLGGVSLEEEMRAVGGKSKESDGSGVIGGPASRTSKTSHTPIAS